MTDFMMEHPWMTFFVAMTLASGVADGIRRLAKGKQSDAVEIANVEAKARADEASWGRR